jgi:hypothetical protein
MCCLLVSGFFTEMTQQIHSLRASGVISCHFASAISSEKEDFLQIRWNIVYRTRGDCFLSHGFHFTSLRNRSGESALDEPGWTQLYAKLPQMMVQMFVHQSCPLFWR